MKDEIQKTLNINDSHPEIKTESREKDVVYTYIGIIDDNLVEVRLGKDDLLERILCPDNLQGAYKQVVGNKGAGGVDEMETSELLPYLNLGCSIC